LLGATAMDRVAVGARELRLMSCLKAGEDYLRWWSTSSLELGIDWERSI